jgi:hypothetical protein
MNPEQLRAECASILEVLRNLPDSEVTAAWAEQKVRFQGLVMNSYSPAIDPVLAVFTETHAQAFTVEGGAVGLEVVMNGYLWTL